MIKEEKEKNSLKVIGFDPNNIQLEIVDLREWQNENNREEIKIGSFVEIKDRSDKVTVALVESFRIIDKYNGNMLNFNSEDVSREDNSQNDKTSLVINAHPLGQISGEKDARIFTRGIQDIVIPPEGVSIAGPDDLKVIYSKNEGAVEAFSFGNHYKEKDVRVIMDGNKFFSKHIAVLGSTGSGKSCTVASILQKVRTPESRSDEINNSHIVIFDVHGEYRKAFPKSEFLSVNENPSDENYLGIPYWLLNSEELEGIFIENSEMNAYNQISQFKSAVVKNKRKYNKGIEVDYDTPVYFSLREVYAYIRNKNFETHYEADGKIYYADKDNQKQEYDESGEYLFKKRNFYAKSGSSKIDIINCDGKKKATNVKVDAKRNGFYGEFPRFINRFETKLNDPRLKFLFDEERFSELSKEDPLTDRQYESFISKFWGYSHEKGKNITIVDLSSLPFEVVSVIVSVISRLSFDLCYSQTRINGQNKTPMLLVYEEAHRYIPRVNDVKYKDTRQAVERIAKEGRKYGISAMIVSQRPSELSTTVLSQCNNFVVMKLTNADDQSIVKSLLPDSLSYFSASLSSLEKQEALITGDAVANSCIIKVDEANPLPNSQDVDVYTEWKEDWRKIVFEKVIGMMKK